MAVKKSEIYSLLWEACNKLRGGVEPARYKDYVLVLLFFKYVSDRYKGQTFADFSVPDGATFEDLVAAKGKKNVGELVDKIIQKFLEVNKLQGSLPDVSFNNSDELGTGNELVDKVSGLIAVFQNPAIDFKNNRASGDDIIGDAYEYFMMKFAQESGKSKGQFYTPSEVSRIIARLIGIGNIKQNPNKKWTLYDPAAGSGSLLIRAADEAPVDKNGDSIVTIFGQEKDNATAGLAKMNLILHQKGTGEIKRGNTLANPAFTDVLGELIKFDFIVMNPPFSDKSWNDGIKISEDKYKRFDGFGYPPEKNGDYAWFLHVIKSLSSSGKAGIVMPHGILFRGNAEETIRIEVLKKRYIKGIVSLPPNLFYGTGIPACIVIIDKEDAENRKGVFLIDASRGFKKDGAKNRLREQDIEKIVQTFTKSEEIPGFSRFVNYSDILEQNEGNLNVPRYIQKIDETLPQNITAHLHGGIPAFDVDSLSKLWTISPKLKKDIFSSANKKQSFYNLALPSDEIETVITEDANIQAQKLSETNTTFSQWKDSVKRKLLNIDSRTNPKTLIRDISLSLLQTYTDAELLDNYDVYDCLLNYWNGIMQDDVYAIKVNGYEVGKEIEYEYAQKTNKDASGNKSKVDDCSKIKSFQGAIIPKEIIEEVFFPKELEKLNAIQEQSLALESEMDEFREEESDDDGLLKEVLNEKGDNITKAALNSRIKELEKDNKNSSSIYAEEYEALIQYKSKLTQKENLNKSWNNARKALDDKIINKYKELSVKEIKDLLFNKKWMAKLEADLREEFEQIINSLSSKALFIAKRYEHTLGEIEERVVKSKAAVVEAMERMGYKW